MNLMHSNPTVPHPFRSIGKGNDHVICLTGISNWALDPAKMNRGLYVTRQEPDLDELKITAQQICKKTMLDQVFLKREK